MNNALKILIVVLLFVVVVWIGIGFLQTKTAKIQFSNGHIVQAEIAQTEEAQERGLGGRASLTENEGMLFVYETPGLFSFWMKDMLIPIDLIWLSDNTVVGFEENMQPENPPIAHYKPSVPVNRVLEVQAGFVKKYSVNIGDELFISFEK